MVREETVLLPLAERVLTDDQWQAAQKGFAAHRDPMYGGDTAHDFESLFERIVRQTPAPEGLADG